MWLAAYSSPHEFDPRIRSIAFVTVVFRLMHRHQHGGGHGVLADARNLRRVRNALRRDRQLEGIAKAKAKGVYRGRPPSIDETKVRALKAEGLGATAIAKKLGIGRASVYRVLGEAT
jgi:helix-turn-helix resolvase-like protein